MDRRTFTPTRLFMVLLVVGLALGIGLAVAQTQSANTPKSVAQTQEAAQPSGDTPGSAAEKPADTPETPAASAEATEAAEAPAAAEDATGERTVSRMRGITNAQRQAAAKRAASRRADLVKRGVLRPNVLGTTNCTGTTIGTPCGLTDYFGTTTVTPNYANSKFPSTTVDNTTVPPTITVTNPLKVGDGIHKFVDSLAGVGSANKNNLGNYIPLAVPFPSPKGPTACTQGAVGCLPLGIPDDGDYYEIGVVDFFHQFHTDLPVATLTSGTNVRGYVDLNGTNTAHYLGPIILAQRDRPVRVKFTNQIVANSNFFIPVDTTVMGAGMGSDGSNYSKNRATIHLHGGLTPWISDGTPHQWTAPAGETTNFKRGVSTQFVPDMFFDATSHAHAATGTNDPGPGSMTFFYSNQQSGRLLFYHDHSYGITRLNVYAGEASAYLLHDPIMDSYITGFSVAQTPPLTAPLLTPIPNNLTANLKPLTAALPGLPGGVYTFGIPLVIQDKTFVPPAAQLAAEDPTWNWGSEGNLWFPHVYMTNQWPDNPDNSGINPMGRWDLGAWFWPPMTSSTVAHVPVACSATVPAVVIPSTGGLCPPTPNPSLVPEAFLDTPVVNGVAYPIMTLPQGAYRFQILNAANDRMFNLSLFYASEKTDQKIVCKPGYKGFDSTGAPYTSAVSNDANCTEVKMVAAVPHPQHYTVGAPPTAPPPVETGTAVDADDALPACVNPSTNPDVNRGSGFLAFANPAAYDYNFVTGMPGAVTPCWPSTWPTDGRDGGVPDPTTAGPAWVQIGTEGGVLPQAVVIPATPVGYNYNRRDVVVTNVQEHALFLGPAERADVIVDFSQVPAGSTLILYNDSPAPVPGFDSRLDYYTGDVDQVSTGGAPTTQPGYGPNIRTIMQIQITGTPAGGVLATPWMTGLGATAGTNLAGLQSVIPTIFKATQPVPIIPETTYTATNSIANPPAGLKNTYARIQDMFLTFTPAGGGAVPTTLDLKPKAIHELFENDYGKMNSILAEEIPLTNYNNQTTIPLAYVDPPTDFVSDGETQLWKVTHNGVDSHAIHFHLFNVQLINRTGWDGALRPPDPNELGWKETVRMNPLEDAFVALQPKKMTLPANFGVSDSVRLLDPTRAEHASNVTGMPGFTNVDPNGNGITVTNEYTNFGWEYVWHCHLLGHEESDMMRPIVFRVASPLPVNNLVAVVNGSAPNQTVTLTWTYIQGATPALTFLIRRSTNGSAFASMATPGLTAASVSFTDPAPAQGANISYQVFAVNGNALSAPANASVVTVGALNPPTNFKATKTGTTITMTWTASTSPGVTGYVVQRATSLTGTWTTIPPTTAATIFRANPATWPQGVSYFFQVQAVGASSASTFAQTTVAIPVP